MANLRPVEQLRGVLGTFYGDEAAKFVHKSWRLGLVTDETLRHVILGIWQVSWPSFALRERDWLAMFSATGFVSEGTPKPTKPLTVYRGARLYTNGRGFSWSLLPEIAEQYVEAFNLSGYAAGVFQTTIPADAALAMIEKDAGEDEVIVDPTRLRGACTPRLIEDEEVEDPFTGLNFSWSNWDSLLRRVEFVSPEAGASSIHGTDHWRRVAEVGLELAQETPGADARVVLLFALWHDALRRNDSDDWEHGARVATLIENLPELAEPLRKEKRRELCEALTAHDQGTTTTNPTIGCCWDADRLDLGRVGIEPDPYYMSTGAGRERAQTAMLVADHPLKSQTQPEGATDQAPAG